MCRHSQQGFLNHGSFYCSIIASPVPVHMCVCACLRMCVSVCARACSCVCTCVYACVCICV